MLHIGQHIKQELLRQERTPSWLARKIHCSRPNVYYIFSQHSINTDLLRQISAVLGHDFFADISHDFLAAQADEDVNI